MGKEELKIKRFKQVGNKRIVNTILILLVISSLIMMMVV